MMGPGIKRLIQFEKAATQVFLTIYCTYAFCEKHGGEAETSCNNALVVMIWEKRVYCRRSGGQIPAITV